MPNDLADAVALFEAVQRERVAAGERLRAVLQARAGDAAEALADDADAVLRDVRAGRTLGPAPALGAAYRRRCVLERLALDAVDDAVRRHAAWPWIERVRGVGPSLAGRLLARLDVARAPFASSFWAYCGLGTVPADGARVRQRWRRAGGGRPGFDRDARALCHLVGVSLMRRGDDYKAYYRDERARLAAARADWSKGRQHLAALRKVEKRFLAELWGAWRAADARSADD